jgi:hypothetical protein
MRTFLTILVAMSCLFLFSCDSSHQRADRYNKGYEAAWEGEDAPSSFWTSKEEKEGYEDGLDDAWTYDTGYYDGYEGKRPQYFNDPLYMDAYKDGKNDKERRW